MIAIAKKHGAIVGGAENGVKGYQLTWMIAYLRDMALRNGVIAESFETSCPWSQVGPLCKNVALAIKEIGSKFAGIPKEQVWVSFRVTQLYETGAAVYVYFSIPYKLPEWKKACDVYEEIETQVRYEVMRHGGCLSHHHGVGKLRKRFMEKTFTSFDMHKTLYKSIKDAVDPKNVFAINNTLYRDDAEREHDLKPKC